MDYTIDATKKPLGRLASEISVILQGKKHPQYDPKDVGTDRVIVKNIAGVALTGKKRTQKIYYRHAGALGHLKERKYRDVAAKDPTWALRNAVRLMLPKNKLNAKRLRRIIFEH